jgi:hypothetical protein
LVPRRATRLAARAIVAADRGRPAKSTLDHARASSAKKRRDLSNAAEPRGSSWDARPVHRPSMNCQFVAKTNKPFHAKDLFVWSMITERVRVIERRARKQGKS